MRSFKFKVVITFGILLTLFSMQTAAFVEADVDARGSSSVQNESSLLDVFGTNNNAQEFLDAEEAFKINVTSYENNLIIQWIIAPKHYLYRAKISVLIDDKKTPITLPQGEEKDDPLFGKVQIFYQSIETSVPLTEISNSNGQALHIHYQGCAEIGVCYAPQKTSFELAELKELFIANKGAIKSNTLSGSPQSLTPSSQPLSETDAVIQQLSNSALWLTIMSFFLAGILLAFTPCIFPLIPILSGILSRQSAQLSSARGLKTSVLYVLSMAFTYAIIGVIVGLLGKNIQAALQTPWVLGSFALIFVLLAFSMFGFYQLQMPLSWQNKLNKLSSNKDTSSIIGIIIMGLLSALIVGPCITPALAGALVYIGQSGDAFTGGLSLFSMGLGMGVPLIMVGAFAGGLLPKAGAWTQSVNHVFGVFMLALAIYFLDRFIPVWLSMLLWSVLLIISAMYLRALEPVGQTDSPWRYFTKGLGIVMILLGIILLVGMSSGGRSLLQPLTHLSMATINVKSSSTTQDSFFQMANTGADVQNKMLKAKENKQVVLLYVTAEWCVSCRELEFFTFSDERVKEAMKNQLAYKIDVTDNTAIDKEFMKSVQVFGPPAILFFDSQGNELRHHHSIGFVSADELLQKIKDWKQY